MKDSTIFGDFQKLVYRDKVVIYHVQIPPVGFDTDKLGLDVLVVGYMVEEPRKIKEGLHSVKTEPIPKSEFTEIEKILKNPEIRVHQS